MTNEVSLTVSQFVEICNQTLDYAFPDLVIEGEVASFKVNQGKWVFFDLKEGEASVNCFMVISQLRVALTDGMKVRVRATPKLTKWGKFSLTVRQVMPMGEGSIKKSFELLKKKLTAEGLFDPARKRVIEPGLHKIGVISSTGAAGYHDFIKIISNRWGGMVIQMINTQVQGLAAPEQIIRALEYYNVRAEVEAIVIIRGGGSADDLAAFNDEGMARAIAASRIPVMTGIGHEVDESLADLAADVRASTPSNAAERLTFDRREILQRINLNLENLRRTILTQIDHSGKELEARLKEIKNQILLQIEKTAQHLDETQKILQSLNPENVLARGYAIVTGKILTGQELQILTMRHLIKAEVKDVQDRDQENHQ